MKIFIGIDIGGTNIKAAAIDKTKKLLGFVSIPTDKKDVPVSAGKAFSTLLADSVTEGSAIAAVGVGVPGIVESPEGPVMYAPNLPLDQSVTREKLAEALSAEKHRSILPEQIWFENDANCAGIAESHLGAGKEKASLLLLTLGTGLGGTVIVNGKPLALGKYGGEFGHVPFLYGGKKCGCGMEGCLEQYTNAAAFQEFGFEKYTSYLAAGIAGFVNIFRPELVVLAGGVTNAGPQLIETVEQKMAGMVYAKDIIRPPKVIRTSLGDEAGAAGAALAGMLMSHKVQLHP